MFDSEEETPYASSWGSADAGATAGAEAGYGMGGAFPASGGGAASAMSELFGQFAADPGSVVNQAGPPSLDPFGPTAPPPGVNPYGPTQAPSPGTPMSPTIPRAPGVPNIPQAPPGGFPQAPPTPATGAGGGGVLGTIGSTLAALGSRLVSFLPPMPRSLLPGGNTPEA
jgi:hypothetical protein